MKIKGGKEIVARFHGTKALAATYHGLQLVWQAVRSCFGKGIWRNDKPWINSDKWKNFK